MKKGTGQILKINQKIYLSYFAIDEDEEEAVKSCWKERMLGKR